MTLSTVVTSAVPVRRSLRLANVLTIRFPWLAWSEPVALADAPENALFHLESAGFVCPTLPRRSYTNLEPWPQQPMLFAGRREKAGRAVADVLGRLAGGAL